MREMPLIFFARLFGKFANQARGFCAFERVGGSHES